MKSKMYNTAEETLEIYDAGLERAAEERKKKIMHFIRAQAEGGYRRVFITDEEMRPDDYIFFLNLGYTIVEIHGVHRQCAGYFVSW